MPVGVRLEAHDAGAHRLIGEMGGQRGAAAGAYVAADDGVRVHCTGSPSTVANKGTDNANKGTDRRASTRALHRQSFHSGQ